MGLRVVNSDQFFYYVNEKERSFIKDAKLMNLKKEKQQDMAAKGLTDKRLDYQLLMLD